MRVLLAVVYLVAVFSQDQALEISPGDQAFEISPGAESGTFLNEVQTEMIEIYRWLYPDGQSLNAKTNIAITVAKADLCKINDEQYQSDRSIFLGTTCKIELVKLYNDDPEQCSALFCDVTTNAETFLLETLGALIAADTDDKFFHIIEEQIMDPMMQYSCRCLIKLLGAWMDCKHNIGEADVWNLLLDLGEYDASAEYLRGQGWKDFWVDVLVERIPWASIKTLFDRTMTHLCQENTDKTDSAKCYTYFHNAFTKLYKVFLKVTGKKPAVKENSTPEDEDTPLHCTTFSRNFFGDIRKTIVAKFCVEDCVPFYQRAFFGCCTASMNEDKALKRAALKTTKRLTKIVEDLFMLIGMEWEEVFQFDIISIIFREFQGVLKMLRTPTCYESYDMTPCTGECQLNEEETPFDLESERLEERDTICKAVSEDEISNRKSIARYDATYILGNSCPSMDVDTVIFGGECSNLVKQVTCYGIKPTKRSDGDVVTYGHLAGEVENIEFLGNLVCSRAAACFKQFQAAIKDCVNSNDNFVHETIEAAETYYTIRRQHEPKIKAIAGSFFGDLASMALHHFRFPKATNILTFFLSHITIDDALAVGDNTAQMVKEWCDSGCASKTVRFLKGLLCDMNRGGCVDASEFCGACQERANSFFTQNTLPCCFEKVVHRSIEEFRGYKKSEINQRWEKMLMSASEADNFEEQFNCVKEVYTRYRPDCETTRIVKL